MIKKKDDLVIVIPKYYGDLYNPCGGKVGAKCAKGTVVGGRKVVIW